MAAQELEHVWQRIDVMRAEHEALHREVVALDSGVKALDRKVDDNRKTRDDQHAEVMRAINELRMAENERAGMAKLGRGVAVAIGATVALFGIVAGLMGYHRP